MYQYLFHQKDVPKVGFHSYPNLEMRNILGRMFGNVISKHWQMRTLTIYKPYYEPPCIRRPPNNRRRARVSSSRIHSGVNYQRGGRGIASGLELESVGGIAGCEINALSRRRRNPGGLGNREVHFDWFSKGNLLLSRI